MLDCCYLVKYGKITRFSLFHIKVSSCSQFAIACITCISQDPLSSRTLLRYVHSLLLAKAAHNMMDHYWSWRDDVCSAHRLSGEIRFYLGHAELADIAFPVGNLHTIVFHRIRILFRTPIRLYISARLQTWHFAGAICHVMQRYRATRLFRWQSSWTESAINLI